VLVSASQDTICPSGSSNLLATGANTYVWSPATGLSCTNCPNPIASPTSTTTYNVEGTNGFGCTSNTSITIYVDQPPTADYLTSSDTACTGQQIIFNGSVSVNASTYNWSFPGGTPSSSTNVSPSVTYSSTGSHPVSLTVYNICNQSDIINDSVYIVNNVTANYTQSADTVCENDYVNYDGGSSIGATSYNWSFPGGTPSSSTNQTPSIQYTTAGNYTFTLIANGNCGSDTINGSIIVEVCTGTGNYSNMNNISSYYNKSSGILVIKYSINMDDNVVISLINEVGQLVFNKYDHFSNGNNRTDVSVGKLATGVYNLSIIGKNHTYNSKLVLY